MGYFKSHVFCCTNERPPGHERGCCKEKGSDKLQKYMKVRVKELGLEDEGVRINVSGCLHRCELGPTMVIYPEGVWYTYKSTGDVDEIIASHLQKGQVVERLRLPDTQPEKK
jgi:(2Fe-2S) ferredoxin